jgi:hypothetical protein
VAGVRETSQGVDDQGVIFSLQVAPLVIEQDLKLGQELQ